MTRTHSCSRCGGPRGDRGSAGYCRSCATEYERERRQAQRRAQVELVDAAKAVTESCSMARLARLRRAVAPFLVIVVALCVIVPRGTFAQEMPPIEQGVATAVALRGVAFQETPLPAAPESRFAPAGLSDCDEMQWYRIRAGLPARFDRLGWRESNCRNEDAVRTFCCYGWWQLYVSVHLRDPRLAQRYAACGVDSAQDVNSDTPIDKWRQACAAKAVNDVQPGAWG